MVGTHYAEILMDSPLLADILQVEQSVETNDNAHWAGQAKPQTGLLKNNF
jgi:hypothetical protein